MVLDSSVDRTCSCSETHSSGRRREIPYSDQVVRSGCKGKHPSDSLYATMAGLSHQPDRLHPAEYFFDSFAFLLADGVSRMRGRSIVDRAMPVPADVLRYMRCHIQVSKVCYKSFRIVAFIGPHGDSLGSRHLPYHLHGLVPLGSSCRLAELRTHHQSVPVLDYQMSQKT